MSDEEIDRRHYGLFIQGTKDTLPDGYTNGVVLGAPPYLEVTLPCGNIRRWLTKADVPNKTIECRCGDLDYPHFFIAYAPALTNEYGMAVSP